jgi:hypothetical protein
MIILTIPILYSIIYAVIMGIGLIAFIQLILYVVVIISIIENIVKKERKTTNYLFYSLLIMSLAGPIVIVINTFDLFVFLIIMLIVIFIIINLGVEKSLILKKQFNIKN